MNDVHVMLDMLTVLAGLLISAVATCRLGALDGRARLRYLMKYVCALLGGAALMVGGLNWLDDTTMLALVACCYAVDILSSASLWRGGAPDYTRDPRKPARRAADAGAR